MFSVYNTIFDYSTFKQLTFQIARDFLNMWEFLLRFLMKVNFVYVQQIKVSFYLLLEIED